MIKDGKISYKDLEDLRLETNYSASLFSNASGIPYETIKEIEYNHDKTPDKLLEIDKETENFIKRKSIELERDKRDEADEKKGKSKAKKDKDLKNLIQYCINECILIAKIVIFLIIFVICILFILSIIAAFVGGEEWQKKVKEYRTTEEKIDAIENKQKILEEKIDAMLSILTEIQKKQLKSEE